MNDGGLHLVKIPVEVWTVSFRVVADRPLAEAEALLLTLTNEVKTLDALIGTFPVNEFPWPILVGLEEQGLIRILDDGTLQLGKGLSEVSGTYQLIQQIREVSQAYRISMDLVRDLVKGNFHHPGVLNELDEHDTRRVTEIKHMEANITEGSIDNLPEYDSENMIDPIAGRIKYEIGGEDIVKRTRQESVTNIAPKSEACVALVLRTGQEGWVQTRPIQKFEKSSLLRLAQSVFEPEITVTEAKSWSAAPEIGILALCNQIRESKLQKRDLLMGLKSSVDNAIKVINDEDQIRADLLEVETGTEYHQQTLLKKLVRKTRGQCVILSSFLHIDFADDITEFLNDALPANSRMLFLYGHADDSSYSEAEANADKYLSAIRINGNAGKIEIKPTRMKTHAKIAVNDQGHCWVGSYNLLSGAPGSETTETGILIQSTEFSKTVVDKMIEWDEGNQTLIELQKRIESLNVPTLSIREKEMKKAMTSANIIDKVITEPGYNSRKILKDLNNIEHVFRGVSERPVLRMVNTSDHRNVVVELIRDAKNKIIMASDRIKPHGLDPVLVQLISAKEPFFETRLVWGREDPRAYNKKKEAIVAARKLIQKLKSSSREGRLLTSSKDPMGSHAKVVQTDDMRVLITSDNILSYGDTSLKSDSRELGILIDSPRISILVRGELELMHRELRSNWYKEKALRWAVALAVAVKEIGSGGKVRARDAVNSMLERCDGGEEEDLWNDIKAIQDNSTSEEFIYQLIGYARRMKLVRVASNSFFYVKPKGGSIDVAKLNSLSLSLPNPNHIWEKAPS